MSTIGSTGAAAFTAGETLAGHDGPESPSAVSTQSDITAIAFDPYDRSYTLQTDQSLKGTTRVLHRAALLILPRGSIPAVASSGINLDPIRRATPAQRLRIIRDQMNLAYQTLLDTGLLAIRSVQLSSTTPWDGRWYADVVDLETGQSATLTGNAT